MAKSTRTKKNPVKEVTPDDHGHKSKEAATEAIQSEQPQINVQEAPAPEKPPEPVTGNNTGQLPAQPVVTQDVAKTYEVIEAKLKKELTRLKYNEALQGLISYKITEDNMGEAQEKLKKARGFLRQFETIKSGIKEEALRECKWIDQAYNSLKNPLEAEIQKKQADLNKIAQEQAEKAEKIRVEEQRKSDIRTAIDNFIIQQSQAIAGCKEASELVTIEKLIGSHRANKSRYQEFLPDFISRSEELTPLIKNQKESIRQLAELEAKKIEAEKNNDDATLIALADQQETLEAKIEENKVIVQETAINSVTKPGEVVTATPIISTIKARRSKWKARLKTDDKSMKVAFNAGLLRCELDPDKVEVLIDTLQQTKQLDGLEKFDINGIELYLEKLF